MNDRELLALMAEHENARKRWRSPILGPTEQHPIDTDTDEGIRLSQGQT